MRRQLTLLLVVVFVVCMAKAAHGQHVITGDEASTMVSLKNVAVRNNEVSGEVVNHSPHLIRDVELLIQYHWLWQREFKPGGNPPGHSVYVHLDRDIAPGQSVPFKHRLQTMPPSEQNGQFMTEVDVAGFTTVVTPKRAV